MIILGLDPGPKNCGWALLDTEKSTIVDAGHDEWNIVRTIYNQTDIDYIAIEKVIIYTNIPGSAYILPDAIENIGRMIELAQPSTSSDFTPVVKLTRAEVIKILTGKAPGRGNKVSKKDVSDIVMKKLKLKKAVKPVHANDAVAVAIAVAIKDKIDKIGKTNGRRKGKKVSEPNGEAV